MTSADRSPLHDLFAAALHLTATERGSYLARHCRDESMRRQVQALLDRHDRLGQFLEYDREDSSHLGIAAGTRLGDFEIADFHAHGGRGVVFRARQLSVGGREVALKVVPILVSARVRAGQRVEADMLARVEHANLVPVHAAGIDEARHLAWCAMRFIDGPTLHDVLEHLSVRGNPPDHDEVSDLVARVAEIADGLGALHAAGIVHRDVKPANILLEGGAETSPWPGPAILVDFGLARESERGGEPSTVAATLAYAAPEQIAGESVDARSDVYSLGLCLSELLAGRRRARRGVDLDPGTGSGSRALDAIVRQATAARPKCRYESGIEFAADLRRWLVRGGVSAPMRWRSREYLRGALVAALTLMIVAFGITVWWDVRAVNNAWQRGDLAGMDKARRSMVWPADLIVPEGIGDPGLWANDVRDVPDLVGEDIDGAVERAAAWIQRDGPQGHPVLLRFLGFAVANGDAVGQPAVRTAARLAFERPAISEDGYGPVAAALRERLAGSDWRSRSFAAMGLGGSGAGDDVALLLRSARDWLSTAVRDERAWDAARVAIEAAAALLRSVSVREGGLPPCDPLALLAVPGAVDKFGKGGPLRGAATRLLVEWVWAHARAGLESPVLAVPREMLGSDLLAAIGDVATSRALLATGPEFSADVVARPVGTKRSLALGWACWGYGRRVALLPRSDAVAVARTRVVDAAGRIDLERAIALAMFDRGVAVGHAMRNGIGAQHSPDDDSRLEVVLETVKLVAAEVTSIPGRIGRVGALVDRPVPRVHGAPPPRLVLANATIDGEPEVESLAYVRLASAGRSAAMLEFDIPDTGHLATAALTLHVEAQKANRVRVPLFGDAAVDVVLDGVVVQRVEVPADHRQRYSVGFRQSLAPGSHTLSLRLARDSTTTLRLFELYLEMK